MCWDSAERRRFVRIKHPCKVTVTDKQEQILLTQTENISVGGLRLFSHTRLEPLSLVNLEIHIKNGEFVSCKGKVVWVFARKAPLDMGSVLFDTGIEFCPMKEKNLQVIKDLVIAIASTEE